VGYRIGMDLVDVRTVSAAVERFGARYLNRVYTSREIADCTWREQLAPHRLAARFAAKEAAMKVLATSGPVPWNDIEVRSQPGAAPELALSGHAARHAVTEQLTDFVVSLSHEGDLSSAVVLARRRDTTDAH
jgi:holo-[acyl-carrier protein] synthase